MNDELDLQVNRKWMKSQNWDHEFILFYSLKIDVKMQWIFEALAKFQH